MMKADEMLATIFENYEEYVRRYHSHVEGYGADHELTKFWKASALALSELLSDLGIEHAEFCYMERQ